MTSSTPSAAACVICGKPAHPAYKPFCSKRCADVDLQRWLSGGYVIPGGPQDEAEESAGTSDDEG